MPKKAVTKNNKREKFNLIGKRGLITIKPQTPDHKQIMKIEVIIMDYQRPYGRDQYFVKPVAGRGGLWKARKNIQVL